jgi:hypothetical protein
MKKRKKLLSYRASGDVEGNRFLIPFYPVQEEVPRAEELELAKITSLLFPIDPEV